MLNSNRVFLSATVLALFTACGSKGSYEGKLTDGLTGQPVADLRIVAQASGGDMTCQVREATTDANGVFTIKDTCADMTYTLKSTDPNRMLQGVGTITGGQPSTGPVEIKSWLAPEGEGVFVVSGGKVKPSRTYADVKTATILGSQQKVRYPSTQPKTLADWPSFGKGDHVLISGKANIEKLEWVPAIVGAVVKFEPESADTTHFSLQEGWTYLGVELKSEKEFTEKKAEVDPTKFVGVEEGDRALRYVPADALAEGHYFLVGPEDKRTFIFQVSHAAPAAEGAAPAAEGAAPAAEGAAPAEGAASGG